jgi:hypothetical protein
MKHLLDIFRRLVLVKEQKVSEARSASIIK